MARQPQRRSAEDNDDDLEVLEPGEIVRLRSDKDPVNDKDGGRADRQAPEDADDEPDQDERIDLGSSQRTPEEVEQVRSRRRRQRERRRQAMEEDRQTIADLRGQVEALTERLSTTETRVERTTVASLDNSRRDLQNYYQRAAQIYEDAISKNDGARARKAQEGMDEAKRRIGIIDALKARQTQGRELDEETQPQGRQPAPQGKYAKDPDVHRFANEFRRDYPEYQPHTRGQPNPETLIISSLDIAVLRDGFDPRTEEYWDELRRRVDRALDNDDERRPARGRQADDDDDFEEAPRRPGARGPRVSGEVINRRRLRPNEMYVSPEHKRALEEAGYWDDPKKRARMLQRYREAERTRNSQSH